MIFKKGKNPCLKVVNDSRLDVTNCHVVPQH